MEHSLSTVLLSDIADPLISKFGRGLSVCRDGNSVRWGFEGQAAVVELLTDGRMIATFIDRECIDAITARPAVAAYRARPAYALTAASCSCMVGDMVDFFSGVREPNFTFFTAYSR